MGSAACAPSPEVHISVDYYLTHPDTRHAVLKQCAQDPGARRDAPECVNAREAARVAGVGSLEELPPLSLPVPSSKPQDAE